MDNNKNFLESFEEIVKRYPNNIAVAENQEYYITYSELKIKAKSLATHLKRNGVTENNLVGIHIEKSIEYIISLLAIWYASGSFIPIDPALPSKRKDFILKNSDLKFILSKTNNIDVAQPIKIIEFVTNSTVDDFAYSTSLNLNNQAYVIYTSGSTGTPKGVSVSHLGLVPMLKEQIKAFNLTCHDHSFFYLSTNFDASLSDIGTSLLSGACLHIERDTQQNIASNLPSILYNRNITYIDIPPSLLRILKPEQMPSSLKTITIGGEALNPEIVRHWAKYFRVINVYGPTEATICTSLVECNYQSWSETTIGKPLSNVLYKIVDENLRDVKENEEGELLIGGIQLAIGYLNNPELTNEKFIYIEGVRYYRSGDKVKQSNNQEPIFIGRIDRQVKINGQLVELGEIEAATNRLSCIKQAAVIKYSNNNDQKNSSLIAFITMQDNELYDYKIIVESLKQYLSPWMIPNLFIEIKELPMTITGKIDYSQLQNHVMSNDSLSINTSENSLSFLEEKIITIWRRVLKKDFISVNDNFFALGGDSFAAIELFLTGETEGLRIPSDMLYKYPTPKLLANILEEHKGILPNDLISGGIQAEELKTKLCFDSEWNSLISSAANRLHLPNKTPEHIFITGANGFLGSRLVYQILTQNPQAKIYALIRARNNENAISRLRDSLSLHGLHLTNDMKQQIIPIIGDISQPFLGLEKTTWNNLSETIDTIIHSAAIVNVSLPYEKLCDVNVDGTKEILRLCLIGRRKILHYISTLSVFVSTDQNSGDLYEDDQLENTKMIYGGYGQTKWAAEYILHQVPIISSQIVIHRLGLITGDSKTGYSAPHDFLTLFIKGLIKLGAVPQADHSEIALDVSTIDYCAQVLNAIIFDQHCIQTNNNKHPIFHIANTSGFSLQAILKTLENRGIFIPTLSEKDWEQRIKTLRHKILSIEEAAAYAALIRILPHSEKIIHSTMDLFQATNVTFKQENTEKILIKNNINIPKADENLLNLYLDFILNRTNRKQGVQ